MIAIRIRVRAFCLISPFGVEMTELLQSLIAVSEKASNIARACRTKKELFSLLVQEKAEKDANPRFIQDFKTLADVLIQETVRHELGQKVTNSFQYSYPVMEMGPPALPPLS